MTKAFLEAGMQVLRDSVFHSLFSLLVLGILER